MCLTTKGVTVMEPMRNPVCLCASTTNQNKALTGAQFSCGAASLCPVLPAPAPFSSPFNHCLFTLSQELNEARLRPLPGKLGRPHPAVHLPPSLPVLCCLPQRPSAYACRQTHTIVEPPPPPTHQLKPWERVLQLLSLPDTEAF